MKQPIVFSVLFLCCTLLATGQTLYLEAGLFSTSFHGLKQSKNTSSIYTTETSAIIRPSVFLKYRTILKGRLSIDFITGYEGRGSRFVDKSSNSSFSTNDRTINLNYLTGAVALMFKPRLKASNRYFEFGGGPYVSYLYSGLESGVNTSYYSSSGSTVASVILNRIIISNKPSDQTFPTTIKPFDFGGNITTRYTYNRFRIAMQYSFGLGRLLTNSVYYDKEYMHASIGLLVAYKLTN